MKTKLVILCFVFAGLINTGIATPALVIYVQNNDSGILVRIVNLKANQRESKIH